MQCVPVDYMKIAKIYSTGSNNEHTFDRLKEKEAAEKEQDHGKQGCGRDGKEPGTKDFFGNRAVNTTQATGKADS